MLFNIPPHSYRPSPRVISRAKDFAEAVVDTVNYRDSNQWNKKKIELDHFISKIGEEAVYDLFSGFFDMVAPDYRIYKEREKSWDADLKVNGVDLAVKTQTKSSADRYGLSWMFQWGQKRRDKVLKDPYAWVSLVQCDDNNPHYDCTIYSPLQIKDIVFGEPKLAKLRGEKKVVYARSNQLLFG